jgi:LEA14-like dessication related protein
LVLRAIRRAWYDEDVSPSRILAAAAFAACAALGCSTPQPPTLTPKKVTVTALSPVAIDVNLELDAANPNSFALAVRTVTAKVRLAGQYDVGTSTVAKPFDLPAKATVSLSVPMSVPWSNVAPLVGLAAGGKDVAYEVEGTVSIGSASLDVTLPFKTSGTMTHDQMVQATMRSIPAIPGITAPPR